MNEKELKDALAELKTDMEGKSKAEAKALVDEFKTTFDDALEEIKTSNSDANDEIKGSLTAIQDHIDKLDVKMQAKETELKEGEDLLRKTITDNFDKIKTVSKGKSVEVKTVGDMTLSASLTGDQYREFTFDVAKVPGQMVNVADLVGSLNIGVGTYTFPRESGGEGTITTQTEGSDKAQKDYDFTMVDVNTDFIAGYCNYSRKMSNNLPFLESFLPDALRRDYWIAENTVFDAVLAAGTTASSQVITSQNKVEMLVQEIATLEGSNFAPNIIVVTPADFWDIMLTEKSTGAGYGLPGFTSYDNGVLRINGIPVVKANWVDTNKYYVGDFSTVRRIITEGLSVSFSEHDEDNFRKNAVTGRVEAQVGLAIHRIDAIIYGDFTAT